MHIKFILTALAFVLSLSLAACKNDNPVTARESDPLLTDDQLITPEDPNARDINPKWKDWIRANYLPIRSLTSENFSDLNALKPYLQDKRIVQLGESSHGVGQFDQVKVRLIKFLHEELGFNVIAFESSIFECFYANHMIPDHSGADIMKSSIFKIWGCTETLELFDYLKRTQETRRPLILAGFDVQPSSRDGIQYRPKFFRNVISKIDTAYARRVFLFDTELIPHIFDENYIKTNADTLFARYNELQTFFDRHYSELADLYKDSLQTLQIARQTALSIPVYFRQIVTDNTDKSYDIRDLGMADNLDCLLNEVYPGKKIITWAHNYHIMHNQPAVDDPDISFKNMGSYIAERYGTEAYTVGLFMYRGQQFIIPEMRIVDIASVPQGGLESIFYTIRKKYSFLDLSRQEYSSGNSWMFQEIPFLHWGKYVRRMVPKAQYDAILFIDTVNPPDFI